MKATLKLTLNDLGLNPKERYTFSEIWSGKAFTLSKAVEVAPGGVVFLKY